MKNFYSLGKSLFLLAVLAIAGQANAQSVSANVSNLVRPVAPYTVSVNLDRQSGGWGNSGSGNYVWTVTPATGVTFGSYSQSGNSAGDVTATFSAAALGTYTFRLTRGSNTATTTVTIGNMSASTSNGDRVAALRVTNGTLNSGPGNIFTPSVTTAALGIAPSGHHYYLPSTYDGNNGFVTVYAANPDGSGNRAIASADLNGSSNNTLGFVRLAIDATGKGWILAGDDTRLYLASFQTNGTNNTSITVVDNSVTLVGGTVSSFFNGDICFSGNGTMYALANSASGGVTQIYVGQPNGSNTVLTKKWDLRDNNGNVFNGSVNGVAFDLLGSLYISTGSGLYYINQSTVNTGTGTVQCALVSAFSGYTDLGSNVYPQNTTLPVDLLSFTGTYNNQATQLNWETAAEVNLRHFEVERSTDGVNFTAIATVNAGGTRYQYTDDLSAVSGNVFHYRLKAVDNDDRFKYSQVVTIRKGNQDISGVILHPSPVNSGRGSIRFQAERNGEADIRVIDLTGKVVLQQKVRVYTGANSVPVNQLDRLKPGNYVLQLTTADQNSAVKFTVIQ